MYDVPKDWVDIEIKSLSLWAKAPKGATIGEFMGGQEKVLSARDRLPID